MRRFTPLIFALLAGCAPHLPAAPYWHIPPPCGPPMHMPCADKRQYFDSGTWNIDAVSRLTLDRNGHIVLSTVAHTAFGGSDRRDMASVTCEACGSVVEVGEWPWCPHGLPRQFAVIDDQLEGGARRFDVLEGEPYIATKSDLKREMDARGLQLYDRHDSHYYKRRLKRHDEELRDTGSNREY